MKTERSKKSRSQNTHNPPEADMYVGLLPCFFTLNQVLLMGLVAIIQVMLAIRYAGAGFHHTDKRVVKHTNGPFFGTYRGLVYGATKKRPLNTHQ